MKSNIELVKEWFKKADNDLLTVNNNLNAEQIPTDTVLFHIQQAIEKYIKGYLTFFDVEFEYTHDLIYLLGLAEKVNSKFKDLIDEIDYINRHAVKLRYPYFFMPTVEEVKEANKTAIKVKNFILSLLKDKLNSVM